MKKLKKEFKEDDYDTVISPFVSVMSNQIIPQIDGGTVSFSFQYNVKGFLSMDYKFKIFSFMSAIGYVYATDVGQCGGAINKYK